LGISEPTTQTASRSVQPFFAEMTADCPCTLQWDASSHPQNCPFSWVDLDPRLIHGSLGRPESQPKRHLDQFGRFFASDAWFSGPPSQHPKLYLDWYSHGPHTLQLAAIPSKLPLAWGSWTPSKTWYVPWAHRSPHSERRLDRFTVFVGLTIVTDRQTDRQTTPSVTISRIYAVLPIGQILITHFLQ